MAKIGANENKYRMLTLEGSFRLQTLVELLFHTLPMMIVILLDSNQKTEWTVLSLFAVWISSLMILKNLGFVTIFMLRFCVEGSEDVQLRPLTGKK